MSKLTIKNSFSLIFGERGWIRGFNNKYRHLMITDKGVFFDGKLIAKGKLKLIEVGKDE